MSVEESRQDPGTKERKAKRKEKNGSKQRSRSETTASEVTSSESKEPKMKSKKRTRTADDIQAEEHEEEVDGRSLPDAEKRSHKKRKSVSFADGLVEDQAEKENLTSTDKRSKHQTVDEPVKQSREERLKEKREKREQRRKRDNNAKEDKISTSEESEPAPSPAGDKSITAYLSQYYNDREAWKFQKIREAQLLKYVFSLEHVSAEYNPALLAYLKGLKSEGARTRLRKSAQEVIKYDEKKHTSPRTTEGNDATASSTLTTVSDDGSANVEEKSGIVKLPDLPESWREAYDDAVYRFKGNLNAGVKDLNEGVVLYTSGDHSNSDQPAEVDPNVLARLEHRKRAEMVLWVASGKINKSTSSASTQLEKQSNAKESQLADRTATATATATTTKLGATKANKDKAPARKKRKNRTMVVEISSSSESSDSDSD